MNMDFYYGVNDNRNNPVEFKHTKVSLLLVNNNFLNIYSR